MLLNFLDSHKKWIKLVGCNVGVYDYFYLRQAADALGYFAKLNNVTESFIDTLLIFKAVLLDKNKLSLCYLHETLIGKTFDAYNATFDCLASKSVVNVVFT